MAGLREIQNRIRSIQDTRKITNAMYLISSTKLKKARKELAETEPYFYALQNVIRRIQRHLPNMESPYFEKEGHQAKKTGLLVISGDKGLAGSFNAVILRSALHFLKANQDKEVFVFAVGKKGRDFLARLKMPNLHLVYESVGIFPKVSYAHAELLGEAVLKTYFEQNLGSVTLIYNDFKSLASQNLVEQKFLPFHFEATENKKDESDFLFEPGMLEIFKLLVPRLVKANMYRMLLESQAANLAATMNAMDAASKNAGELVAALGVKLNKVRQASITNEILDIVNGAEALNS